MRAFPPGFKVNIALFFFYQQLLKDAISRYLLWIFCKMLKLYQLHSVNSKDFGAVLLFETLYFARPLVCSAKDSVKDGHAGFRHGLKLEKVGPTFSRFNLPAKITKQFIMGQCALTKFVWYIFYSSTGAFRVWKTRGGYSTNVYTGRLCPELQPLIWCFPMVNAWAPFYISFFKKKVPLSYKTTCRRFRAVHQTFVKYSFVRNSPTSTTHPNPLPAHSVCRNSRHDCLTSLSTTREKQDKLNITLLVTQQT